MYASLSSLKFNLPNVNYQNKKLVLSQLATTGNGNILKENKSFQNLLSPKFSGK